MVYRKASWFVQTYDRPLSFTSAYIAQTLHKCHRMRVGSLKIVHFEVSNTSVRTFFEEFEQLRCVPFPHPTY